jgi:pimeloyl-ACP methyl ester carboxylesterase
MAGTAMTAAQHRAGTGEPLVLVHGFSGTWRIWDPVLPALEQRHDVLAITLLGHHDGAPFPPGATVTFDALVDGVERDMDDAGLETAHVVGNSLGGWIALELGRRGRARSVVALAPGGGWDHGSREQRRLERLFRRTHHALHWIAPRADRLVRRPRARALLLRDLVAHPERVTPAAAEAIIRGAAECPAYLDVVDAIKRDGPPKDLSGIEVTVRIAWGTRDRILPLHRYSYRLRQMLPDAEFTELRGLGHVPMSDDPAATARTILEVTARGPRATAPLLPAL